MTHTIALTFALGVLCGASATILIQQFVRDVFAPHDDERTDR